MSDRPEIRLLPGHQQRLSPALDKVVELERNQPPLRKIYGAYKRVSEGNERPGDKFYLMRKLVSQFGVEGAFILLELSRNDDYASWRWGISLFERKPPIYKTLMSTVSFSAKDAKEANKQVRDWGIYNRVLDMIESGSTLDCACKAIAGSKPYAANLGKDSIEAIWKKMGRAVEQTGERLVPNFVGMLVMPPGQRPKRGRPKKA